MGEFKAAVQAAENIYDRVPYPVISHSSTHPDRLATVATLLGMDPAPLEQCRVLEIGCAGGGNLIPMAQALPDSKFVGIDLSAEQVAQGETMRTALRLTNVTLQQMDIMEVTPALGDFDYIIAHGIYSWVPLPVRDKLLEICRQNLAPNGVAYVSYNTYPGWNMLGALREMMRYHTRRLVDPQAQITEARVLLDFLAKSISTDGNTHGSFLYVYVNYIKDYFLPKNDAFLLHDELAEINDPIYFHQFAEQAEKHGLKYLGDVQFSSMLATNLPAEISNQLRRMANNTVELEQYLDFLTNRMFRQSLLCHQAVRLSAQLNPTRLRRFYVASSALAESDKPSLAPGQVERFQTPDGANFATDQPLAKAAMLHLIDVWPQAVAFDDLVTQAQARLGSRQVGADRLDEETRMLGANLLKAYSYSDNLVELHVYAPRFVSDISERPVASPVARFQARQGHSLTNLRHERLNLDKISALILPYLDGEHDRAGLLALMQASDAVEITRQDGRPIEDPAEWNFALAELLQAKLQQFANAALLVG